MFYICSHVRGGRHGQGFGPVTAEYQPDSPGNSGSSDNFMTMVAEARLDWHQGVRHGQLESRT